MIEMIKREKYPFADVPENYIQYVEDCVDEIDMILSVYNLPLDTVEYVYIKEKYGRLDIHLNIPKLSEELTREERIFYDTLRTIVVAISRKWQREVYDLLRNGRL